MTWAELTATVTATSAANPTTDTQQHPAMLGPDQAEQAVRYARDETPCSVGHCVESSQVSVLAQRGQHPSDKPVGGATLRDGPVKAMTKAPPLTVPPFRTVSGSYRMRHLHASASSQETDNGADPIHVHPHQGRRTRRPTLALRLWTPQGPVPARVYGITRTQLRCRLFPVPLSHQDQLAANLVCRDSRRRGEYQCARVADYADASSLRRNRRLQQL